MKKARKAWEPAATAYLALFIYKKEVMRMDDIVSIISSVGFPIAMCLILFWYMQKESENHKTETNSLKDAITELKVAITALINRIDKEE